MSERRILIIGGGPAGTFAALAAKKRDPGASIVLLTREHCEPYEKPPLSKAVLLGAAIEGVEGVRAREAVQVLAQRHYQVTPRQSRMRMSPSRIRVLMVLSATPSRSPTWR